MITADDSGIPGDKIMNGKDAAQLVREWCVFQHDIFEPADVTDLKSYVPPPQQAAQVAQAAQVVVPPTTTIANKWQAAKNNDFEEWCEGYNKLCNKGPIGLVIGTEDQSPVKIEIICRMGQVPFMSTKIYVPSVVGAPLSWFAQKANEQEIYGWTVILLTRAREEAMRRFDLTKKFGLVGAVRPIRMAPSGRSFLAEIARWE